MLWEGSLRERELKGYGHSHQYVIEILDISFNASGLQLCEMSLTEITV